MQQAGYHQTNALATQLQSNMNTKNQEIMSMLQVVIATTTMQQDQPLELTQQQKTMAHQANATKTDQIQLEILCILQQM